MINNFCNFIIFTEDKDIDLIIKILIILIIILFTLNEPIYICLIIFILLILNNNIKQKKINKKICRNSTINNPYGNILITTDENKLNIDSCNIKDEIIQNNVEYNHYFNSNDLFKNKNNNRVYIKYKTKYPNDLNEFIDNLYKSDDKICKLNSYDCGKKNSLKFDRYNYI